MSTVPAVNYWPDKKCARAFWSQRQIPAYRWLLRDTAAWLQPRQGERWIDLGCGGGQLTRTLWEKSGGELAEVTALDVAPANEEVIAKLRARLRPSAGPDRVRFLCADFSGGLAEFAEASQDGAVSGLAIQYAEHWDAERGCWTDAAYDRLLGDVFRVLRPGGVFVFSVNVPRPSWWTVALTGVPSFFVARKPLVHIKNCWRMMRYGRWLKHEARQGRFHYLPWPRLAAKLTATGFNPIEHRLSFAGQAYVVRCRKPPAR